MSDFILSLTPLNEKKITKEIQSIYSVSPPGVKEYHGNWGSLGVSNNLYNGFNTYEDDEFIAVVLGGPLLTFRDNKFLNELNSNTGTKSILQRWQSNQMEWDNDLSGPFVVLFINKITNTVNCVTDLMSFIPVYSYSTPGNIAISTHVDSLAEITSQKKILDDVSIVDFILHGIITYPHTMYQSIYQITPASEHKIGKNLFTYESKHYWVPEEHHKYISINEAVNELRNQLEIYIKSITSVSSNIAQFISGGEDSRLLSSILRGHSRNAFVFVDERNRESKIAERIAEIYNANLEPKYRDKMHYLNILPNCSDLVGTGSQYHHAHTYGFHKSCELDSYTAVFGGLFSDALFKGSRIAKKKFSKRFAFIPDIKNNNYTHENLEKNRLFKNELFQELKRRRQKHLKYIKSYRQESAEEWFELWPSSMNSSIPNIDANRRLFRSYEPFTSNEIVKLSASVPQKWKLNRKLFHKAAKTYLKPSKYLLHSKGSLPYFSWQINTIIQFTTWFYRQVGKRAGFLNGNQGPWGDWRMMVHTSEWDDFVKGNLMGFSKIPFSDRYQTVINNSNSLIELVDDELLKVNQYVNLTQLLYELNKD